ncbi:MAG: hypothetical protein Q9160_006178 [Pyrenula sp. 1 TL-2023]
MSLEELVTELVRLEQFISIFGPNQNALGTASSDQSLEAARQQIARRISDEHPDLSSEVLEGHLSAARRRSRQSSEVPSDRQVELTFVARFGQHYNQTHLAWARRSVETALQTSQEDVTELVVNYVEQVVTGNRIPPLNSLLQPNNPNPNPNPNPPTPSSHHPSPIRLIRQHLEFTRSRTLTDLDFASFSSSSSPAHSHHLISALDIEIAELLVREAETPQQRAAALREAR